MTGSASIQFRGPRQTVRFTFHLETLPDLKNAFPLYYNWYTQHRGQPLPKGWILLNLQTLESDFIQFDNTGTARAYFDFLNSDKKKAKWFARTFMKLRVLLDDGIIRETVGSAPMGQPTTVHPERQKEYRSQHYEDEDRAIARDICRADSNDRKNAELKAQRDAEMSVYLNSCVEAIFRQYPDTDSLANYLLSRRTEFDLPPNIQSPYCTSVLPFGAKTVLESIKTGLRNKYFHFNFCTTTLSLDEGEWHNYITGFGRNGIFSHANTPDIPRLSKKTLFHTNADEYDLKFLPVFSYKGSDDNGQDRLLLSLETKCQTVCHQKAPVGTLGYRYNFAGQPVNYNDDERVCTLMLVWSECKLLKKVEAGELIINPTKPHVSNSLTVNYNMKVWNPNMWEPVELEAVGVDDSIVPVVPDALNDLPDSKPPARDVHDLPTQAASVPDPLNDPPTAQAASVPDQLNDPPPARAASVPDQLNDPLPARAAPPVSNQITEELWATVSRLDGMEGRSREEIMSQQKEQELIFSVSKSKAGRKRKQQLITDMFSEKRLPRVSPETLEETLDEMEDDI